MRADDTEPGDFDPIIELLALWDEKRQRGELATPEQLCPGDPVLQASLGKRIARRLKMLQQIEPPTLPVSEPAEVAPALPRLDGYEFHEVLGSGGMGIVYKAREIGLNRIVAIKMLLGEPGSAPRDLARFRAEAQTVAKLHHPHIVQIHEIGEHAGRPYLALEYLEGGSLANLLKGNPIAPRRAAELIGTLAKAAQHAHDRGIVHRDLKPANILLSADGTPKIADFGLSKRLDEDQGKTRTGTVMGTPSYMAPEQALGRIKAIGPATDIFALGVILYEMLMGRVPFAGTTFLETLEQVRSQDPVPPRQLVSTIPKDLETICLKCLNKEPERRYSGADELAQDIQRFLDGEPIHARPDSLREQIVRALIRSNRDTPMYGAWSRMFLTIAPFPALIHLPVTLLFQHTRYFPYLIVPVSMATSVVVQFIVLRAVRAGMHSLPARFARHASIMTPAVTAANLLVLLGIWWSCPPDEPERLLLFYPLLAVMVALVFFSFASEMGWFWVSGVAAFLAAIAFFLFPLWAPLIVGFVMSLNMASLGLFFRRIAAETKKAEAADAAA